MKFAIAALGTILAAQAADTAYIVGMYSEKERRGLGGRFLMKVDGKKVASLRYPTYYRLEVPPGVYNITMDDKDRPPILCHLIAGESCYIRARLVGHDNVREVHLISPHEAAVQLQKLLPIEQESIYIKLWK
jgi:hypothetical protein